MTERTILKIVVWMQQNRIISSVPQINILLWKLTHFKSCGSTTKHTYPTRSSATQALQLFRLKNNFHLKVPKAFFPHICLIFFISRHCCIILFMGKSYVSLNVFNFSFFSPEKWHQLPNFPNLDKWGYSIVSLNNDVYVTGEIYECNTL